MSSIPETQPSSLLPISVRFSCRNLDIPFPTSSVVCYDGKRPQPGGENGGELMIKLSDFVW